MVCATTPTTCRRSRSRCGARRITSSSREHLWGNIAHLARTQNDELLNTLQAGLQVHRGTNRSRAHFQGLFSEINLGSDKLGRTYADRNAKLCAIITEDRRRALRGFSTDIDALGDAYEYLIGQFAAGSGKKAGEFYTPQQISNILSAIVTLDSQEPKTGPRKQLDSVLDFACGSGSLLLNVRNRMEAAGGSIGKIYGQEKNITTYNLARMNMLLHGVKDTEFEIYHGDTLTNDWDMLRETNPAKKPQFDAVVANPPFSYRWEPSEAMAEDMRFKNHGVAPKSAADFAFLLHGFHYLKDDGVMAIILPHGVLFRGGAEAAHPHQAAEGRAHRHRDRPAGEPVLFHRHPGLHPGAEEVQEAGRRALHQRRRALRKGQAAEPADATSTSSRIIETYQQRPEKPIERYSRRVAMEEIEENDYNLNISRYVSTAEAEKEIDLNAVHADLVDIEMEVADAKQRHNAFLDELRLPRLP